VNGTGEFSRREFPAERKRIDIGDYYTNFDLARVVLGWEPQVSLRTGLAQTLAFYRQHLGAYL
jgi:UDP-glucose 4-epimerase